MSMITAALGAYATMGIKRRRRPGRQDLRRIADVDQLRARGGDRFRRHARGVRAPLDRHRSRHARQARRRDRQARQVAVGRPRDRGAALAVGARHARRRRTCSARSTPGRGMRERLLDGTKLDVNWDDARPLRRQGRRRRSICWSTTPPATASSIGKRARAAVARDIQLNIAGTALALLLSALVAWALARRIVGPVAVASNVAERIAAGKLDVAIPKGSADELGALLAAMGVMRDNIKTMMEREVAQRRSAQARLADALESSQEGVVVVDADDCIVLANAAGRRFPRRLAEPAQARHAACRAAAGLAAIRRRRPRPDAASTATRSATGEVSLADGRWLRISHSATRDGASSCVCSDISLLEGAGGDAARNQPAARRRARQHVAGPVPVRRAEPARGRQPAVLRNLRAAARPDPAGHQLPGNSRDRASPPAIIADKTVDELLAEHAPMFMRTHASGTHLLRAQRRPRGRHASTARRRTAAGSRPTKTSPSAARPKRRSCTWRATTR